MRSESEQVFRDIVKLGGDERVDGEGVVREVAASFGQVDHLIMLYGTLARETAETEMRQYNRIIQLEDERGELRRLDESWSISALRAGIGAARISHERARQQIEEGYGADHDREHTNGELVEAAIAYATLDESRWPWSRHLLKLESNNHARNLAKAGALIAAEIDRLERTGQEVDWDSLDSLEGDL